MIDILVSAVLPVFALVAIGFGLGRMGVFDQAMASAVNRLVFLVSVPALIFGLLARSPFEQFVWPALAAFVIVELAMYGTGFLVARYLFGREVRESLLIGLATAFANHLLFVLPIAETLFGQDAALPIIAIATIDALFIYGGTLLLMDALSESGASVGRVLKAFSKNPQILAALAGLGVGVSGFDLAEGIYVFTDFAGGTAAPCSLFALGVILSRQESGAALMLPLAISGLKLAAYPLLCWGLIIGLLDVELNWAKPTMMVAAAPSSAMAFVLALNYRVPTKAIARAILMTMIGSLLTVTYFSSI
jgi:predicted permease